AVGGAPGEIQRLVADLPAAGNPAIPGDDHLHFGTGAAPARPVPYPLEEERGVSLLLDAAAQHQRGGGRSRRPVEVDAAVPGVADGAGALAGHVGHDLDAAQVRRAFEPDRCVRIRAIAIDRGLSAPRAAATGQSQADRAQDERYPESIGQGRAPAWTTRK